MPRRSKYAKRVLEILEEWGRKIPFLGMRPSAIAKKLCDSERPSNSLLVTVCRTLKKLCEQGLVVKDPIAGGYWAKSTLSADEVKSWIDGLIERREKLYLEIDEINEKIAYYTSLMKRLKRQ